MHVIKEMEKINQHPHELLYIYWFSENIFLLIMLKFKIINLYLVKYCVFIVLVKVLDLDKFFTISNWTHLLKKIMFLYISNK